MRFVFELFDFDGSADLTAQEFGVAFRAIVNAAQRLFGLPERDCLKSDAIAACAPTGAAGTLRQSPPPPPPAIAILFSEVGRRSVPVCEICEFHDQNTQGRAAN